MIPDSERYDRQIRVFGLNTQQKLSQCNLLIIGTNLLTQEILKNLVLTGVRSISILPTGQTSPILGILGMNPIEKRLLQDVIKLIAMFLLILLPIPQSTIFTLINLTQSLLLISHIPLSIFPVQTYFLFFRMVQLVFVYIHQVQKLLVCRNFFFPLIQFLLTIKNPKTKQQTKTFVFIFRL